MTDNNIDYVLEQSDVHAFEFLENIDKVCEWGVARNITAEGGATAMTQCVKMAEELQEFIDAKNEREAQDAIGDMFVVLIQIARLRGIFLDDALKSAWNQIKDRKGTMISGLFVKETA